MKNKQKIPDDKIAGAKHGGGTKRAEAQLSIKNFIVSFTRFAILKFCLFALVVSLCGCATIIDGSRQQILVNTYPAQAKIYRGEKELGLTPAIFKIRRKEDLPLVLKSEGYETREINLSRRFNWTTVINFINVYGYILDAITGSMHRFEESSLVQSLVAKSESRVVSKADPLDKVIPNDSVLFWNTEKLLEYSDFAGCRDEKQKIFSAATCSIISCRYVLSDTLARVQLLACFYKHQSFFKARKDDKKYVLNHEQQHFNITELMSRKIRQQLAGRSFSRLEFDKELNKLVFAVLQESDAYQAEYDQDVYNINNIFQTGKQIKWDKKVAEQLDDLKAFEASEIAVHLN